jgi:hypothetical protein
VGRSPPGALDGIDDLPHSVPTRRASMGVFRADLECKVPGPGVRCSKNGSKTTNARPVASVLCGEMAVAHSMARAWLGHSLSPMLNEGEPAVLYCFVLPLLAVAGTVVRWAAADLWAPVPAGMMRRGRLAAHDNGDPP